ncbi:uncharacterized protein LOC104266202 [Ciona intestinalis]
MVNFESTVLELFNYDDRLHVNVLYLRFMSKQSRHKETEFKNEKQFLIALSNIGDSDVIINDCWATIKTNNNANLTDASAKEVKEHHSGVGVTLHADAHQRPNYPKVSPIQCGLKMIHTVQLPKPIPSVPRPVAAPQTNNEQSFHLVSPPFLCGLQWKDSFVNQPPSYYLVPPSNHIVSLPNYTVPQPNYNVPQPNQIVPQPNYTVPQPNYTVPQPNQIVAPPNYNVPQPNQIVPQPNYTVPQPNYTVPKPNQIVPQLKYAVPQPNYNVQPQKYNIPRAYCSVQLPNNTVSPPNYNALLSNYGVRLPNYNVSPFNYNVSSPNYNVHPPNYMVPPPNHTTPPPNYNAPLSNYNVPLPNYNVPPSNFFIPSPNYNVLPPNNIVPQQMPLSPSYLIPPPNHQTNKDQPKYIPIEPSVHLLLQNACSSNTAKKESESHKSEPSVTPTNTSSSETNLNEGISPLPNLCSLDSFHHYLKDLHCTAGVKSINILYLRYLCLQKKLSLPINFNNVHEFSDFILKLDFIQVDGHIVELKKMVF